MTNEDVTYWATLRRIEEKLDTLLRRFPEPRPHMGSFASVETEEQEHAREARERTLGFPEDGPLPHHQV